MRYLLAVLPMLLTGCAGYRGPGGAPPAVSHYPLQHPRGFDGALTLEQILDATFNGAHYRMHVMIEMDHRHMLVVGFTDYQTRAFHIRYDGGEVTFQNNTSHHLPFPPDAILSDIQMVYWPELPDQQGWRIEDEGPGHRRAVYHHDKLAVLVEYGKTGALHGDVRLSNLRYGYRLGIRTLQVWER